MRERIARALCDDTLSRWRSPIAMKREPWREFLPAADAVLSTLAEPDEGMLEAAVPEPTHLYGKDGRGDDYIQQMRVAVQIDRIVAAATWREMIAAARLPGVGGE